jgi:hypothetical protein
MSKRFEHLPNELLMDLFSYFDVTSLYCSFWNINRRINYVLRSLTDLSFIMNRKQSNAMDIFVPQITRLKVNTSENIDLSRFVNLRTLDLSRANHSQLSQIRSHLMTQLVSLTLTTSCFLSMPSDLIQTIFSGDFHSLRHVRLGRVDSTLLPSTYQSTSLHRLYLTCINLNIIRQILVICPNLSCLHGTYLGENHHVPCPSSPFEHRQLHNFSLHDPYHKLSTESITILFHYMPNVESLQLQCACQMSFLYFLQTIDIHLKYLKSFECDILEWPQTQIISLDTLQNVNELFQCLQCTDQEHGYRLFVTE